jgi:hypothetical protein
MMQSTLAVTQVGQGTGDVRAVVQGLQRQVLHGSATRLDHEACEAIVRLALQPAYARALAKRRDREEAIRDIATCYAFDLAFNHPDAALDALSSALVARTLDLIGKRARLVETKRGDDPTEVEPELVYRLCRDLARWVPRKPMGAHIQWQLEHYESDVSRAMRQIKHLVTRPEVTEAFVTYMLSADAAPALKARLLNLARGGGLTGVDYAATIHFFAQPETVAFIKGFAETVQTARTLYAEEEYAGIAWRGKRRMRVDRRQGYLDAALAELARRDDVALDMGEEDGDEAPSRHEAIPDGEADAQTVAHEELLHTETFEAWVTRQATAADPTSVLWRMAARVYIEGKRPAQLLAQGLADADTLTAMEARLAELRANRDIWHLWVSTTLR